MRRPIWFAALCATTVVLASCGATPSTPGAVTTSPDSDTNSGSVENESLDEEAADDEAFGSATPARDSDSDSGSAVASGPLASMLVHVPDTPANRGQLLINDYERALDVAGLSWPSPDDERAVADVLAALTFESDPPIVVNSQAFGNRLIELDEWRTQFGFSVVDAKRDVFAGEAPGELAIVATGRSVADIQGAIRSDPVWSADLVEVSSTGGGYFVWGEDPFATEFDRVSGPRPLGRGGALGVLPDGTVIRSVDPAVVEQSLAASSGEARSLVDDASYAAAADTLDASGVYSAMLTSENITIDPLFLLGPLGGEVPTAEEVEEKLDSIVTLPPYLALGIGNKIDPDADPQGVLVVVVVAANAEAAQETITAMEAIVATGTSIAFDAPWSDLLTVSATEAKGSVAIIEFQTENPRIGISAYLQRDTLFVSG